MFGFKRYVSHLLKKNYFCKAFTASNLLTIKFRLSRENAPSANKPSL